MLYLDIRPMVANEFTGIPQLTWHMARFWLNRRGQRDLRFLFGGVEVARSVVERMVALRSGRFVKSDPMVLLQSSKPLSAAVASNGVAMYPHFRPFRTKRFRRELRIMHDLTGVLTPEFHPAETVDWEMHVASTDIDQIDRFVCVSDATRQDLCTYYGVPTEKVSVAYPGVEWHSSHHDVYRRFMGTRFDPYILILGTFEPRKNLELVFRYLRTMPGILDRYRFVFCGSHGWGGVYERCIDDPTIASLIERDRLRLFPFVNEHLKFALMKEASLLLYPSFIEGFGSPVAEALSLGVPVVASFGGSVPEVAGDGGYYFDPQSVVSLADALSRASDQLLIDPATVQLRARRQGRRFTWTAFNQAVAEIAESLENDRER